MGLPARRAWACAIACLGACLEPQLVPCGDLACPTGLLCVGDEVCASPEQVTACDGLADGASCVVGGNTGRCDRGVCVGAGCGNGVVDPGEACDDANQSSGDGCRADCRKIEMCGDAIVDDGEGCDDGNANAADGCDACVPTTWRAASAIGGNTLAIETSLATPSGIAVDRLGNVYVAHEFSPRIRRIDTTGVITTVAGTGIVGDRGDGGAATSAQLSAPSGITIDGLGNLYIADPQAGRVRRVDPTGVITTVAGSGTQGFGGDGAAATSAQLAQPRGVAIDGLGNLYVADTQNHRVRRIDAVTGVITTLAGDGTPGVAGHGDGGLATGARLSSPEGIAVDGTGTLYVADTGHHAIRRIDGVTGTITTVAGTGAAGVGGDDVPATTAPLHDPRRVALDPLGNLLIADSTNDRIRRVDRITGRVTTIAGVTVPGFSGDGGPAVLAQLATPSDVAVDPLGTVYIADSVNGRARVVDATTGIITTIAGTGALGFGGTGGAATSTVVLLPFGVADDGAGGVFITDTYGHRIRRVSADGIVTEHVGTGNVGFSGDGGPASAARIAYPQGLARDALGNLYLADTQNRRVRRVSAGGVIETIAGTGTAGGGGDGLPAITAQLRSPADVALDATGATLYVADAEDHRVRRIDLTTGVITTVAGTGTAGYAGDGDVATSARLFSPGGVAVDALGALYIADTRNHAVRRVSPAGLIETVAGTGVAGATGDGDQATSAQLTGPLAVAIDGAGDLWIADTGTDRIRKVDASTGVITTVVGSSHGLAGDGGPAAAAQLSSPSAIAFVGADLYVADTANLSIRRVTPAGTITTVAGPVDPEGMGPLARARLVDPRGLVVTTGLTLIAGGSSGTVQAVAGGRLAVVAGRYLQTGSVGDLARYRGIDFGAVEGIAFDAAAGRIFVTEQATHRVHVITVVDPADATTWTIAPLANVAGTEGFADGPAAGARFREPSGLFLDPASQQLYVADTGNHVVRAIDLSGGLAAASVRTIAGVPATRGFFGDGGPATAALLYRPQALTRCANGDLFVADTANHRVRRIAAGAAMISTVLGVGAPASSGDGRPATTFPVNAPRGLACDERGNLFVTSTTTVRLLPADAAGIVDGTSDVQTIYGVPPVTEFPASVTRCLTGLAVLDAVTLQVTDSCTGILVELTRETVP